MTDTYSIGVDLGGTNLRIAPCAGGTAVLETITLPTRLAAGRDEVVQDLCEAVTAHDLALLASSGDRQALGIFNTVGDALAIALTGLVNTLNLPLSLLGGGVCEAWDLFSPAMFRELEHRSYVYRLTKPDVLEPARLEAPKTYTLKAQPGPTAGLLGACVLGLKSALFNRVEELLAHQ